MAGQAKIATVEFLTFIETPGVRADIPGTELADDNCQTAIDACPWRRNASAYERKGVRLENARCAFMGERLAWSASLERGCCARCVLHGGPGEPPNPYLVSLVKHGVYSRCVPNPSLPGTHEKPAAAEIDKCIVAAKGLAGAEQAGDLITTMVVTGVLTPEEAVDLHEKHGLIAADPEPAPVDGGDDAKQK